MLLHIALGTMIFAVSFWVAIRILEPYNTANKFSLALFAGLLVALVGTLGGQLLLFLPLIALCYLLINHYEMGFFKSVTTVFLASLFESLGEWLVSGILPA